MQQTMTIDEMKRQYPDEWVLVGSPMWGKNNVDVVSGDILYHSPDKKEVCYRGREKTAGYDSFTLVYTQTSFNPKRTLGILIPAKQ